jgi:ABC-2 type transport system permease protein
MKKIIAIAGREYRAMVGTKAFLFSILMMPLLMFGSIVAMQLLKNTGKVETQKIVINDHSKKLYSQLAVAARQVNEIVDRRDKSAAERQPTGSDDGPFGDFSSGKRYELEPWQDEEISDEQKLELSDRIRRQDLYAFVEIPANVVEYRLSEASADPASIPTVSFYSEDSSFSDAKSWIGSVISEFARTRRLQEQGIDAGLVAEMSTPVPIRGLSPLKRTAAGEIAQGEVRDPLRAIFVPLGIMMLMFMVIFMSSQPMLETVLEEKSARIAEVLLGSASSWQLMTGKLLGTVGGSLTILVVYLGGVCFLAWQRGWTDQIPLHLIPWFVLFQILGVLLYASIFMAIGASVSQLKEAQSMLLPVWMLLMSPMFVWMMIIREPNSQLSTLFSFFPPATPTVMVLRMSTDATVPGWQPLLASVLLVFATVVCVYVASRIFRVGLLWQGKTPKLGEILKWAFSG